MNILVVNDDGIEAEGIKKLVEALSGVANVYVCAPHTQRSSTGHGISINHPVRFDRVPFPGAKIAFSLEGLPADCVKMGMAMFKELGIGFNKVFSGINHGSNLGTDAIYSGTVAAALEGAINGIPSVAMSLNAHKALQYETAKSLAAKIACMDLEKLSPRLVLNINIPNLPDEQIRGIKVVRQGIREYTEWYDKSTLDDGTEGYVYSGRPIIYDNITCDTSDVGADQESYISITPLKYDLTDYELLDRIKKEGMFD